MKMKVYEATVRVPNAGAYVPPDPCAGGGYNRDAYYTHFITCSSMKRAREILKLSYPSSKISIIAGKEA
jgi:hypothetical protein